MSSSLNTTHILSGLDEFVLKVDVMRLDIALIRQLIHELQKTAGQPASGGVWPHPWDHYPFQINGQRKWLRYKDLAIEQKQRISRILDEYSASHNN